MHCVVPVLQPYTRSVYEKCVSSVEGARCSNPCLPMSRHCLSRILLITAPRRLYLLGLYQDQLLAVAAGFKQGLH